LEYFGNFRSKTIQKNSKRSTTSHVFYKSKNFFKGTSGKDKLLVKSKIVL
jgi:hypothetical protein